MDLVKAPTCGPRAVKVTSGAVVFRRGSWAWSGQACMEGPAHMAPHRSHGEPHAPLCPGHRWKQPGLS